jgi:hypothetical protein
MNDSSLGCYSVIRYRDALSDQQVNLGVLLWHPQQGYRVFFVPNFDVTARAIAPNLQSQDLKFRLSVIEQQVNQNGKAGPEKFKDLCNCFRDGVEVTSPYPAKFGDLDSALHLLRPTLFPQTPTMPAELALQPQQFLAVPHHGTASQFERKVFRTIETVAENKQIQAEPLQPRKIGKIVVNPGLRTISSKRKALWRTLSFQSRESLERRLFHAKAVAMEMYVVSGLDAFKECSRYIVLQSKQESSTDELVAWLRRSADHVFPVETPEGVKDFIDRAL